MSSVPTPCRCGPEGCADSSCPGRRTLSPAEALDAMRHQLDPVDDWREPLERAAAELRRLAAVERERDLYLSRLDRAINAAVEHFGEGPTRYKFSLFANGRARNVFPREVEGHWFALQRADNDAHVGLALRCAEAEADRDRLAAEVEALRADAERYRKLVATGKYTAASIGGGWGLACGGGRWTKAELDAAADALPDAAIDSAKAKEGK